MAEPHIMQRFAEAHFVGECGLDKACNTPFDLQMTYLRWQLDIAEALRKPVVLHCVHAFNEIIALRKHYSMPWVIHGFTGSLQLARQLASKDIGISFGTALLEPQRLKVRNTFQQWQGHYMLETDDNPCGIDAVYAAAALIKGLPIDEIKAHVAAYYLLITTSNNQLSCPKEQ